MVRPTPDVDPVLADLRRRGYETTRLDGATTPPAVARGGDPPGAVTDRPLSVEPLAEATPLSVVAAVADAARQQRGTLFVADPAVAASDPTWREDADAGGVTGEDRALVLESDGEPLAALESVDALTCPGPGPAAFPYRYERGEAGRFHVHSRDREVGTFTSFGAMESRGFHPVDLPLVPEHHLRENAHLARRWTVATVEGGSVEYVTA